MSKSYKEDHRPSLQFYINDWLAEPGLNMCSLASQGLWIKMICYMFKSDFRGCLQANQKQITPKQLSKLCSETEDVIIELLNELKEYKVFSTLDDGTIYSRRMYRHTLKEREISEKRSAAGKQGGRPVKKQTTSKDKAKEATSTSISSSTATIKKKEQLLKFDLIYQDYPNKDSRKQSLEHFMASVTTDEDFTKIKLALKNYLNHLKIEKWKKPQSAKTWFNNWEDWVDFLPEVVEPTLDEKREELDNL